MSADIQPLRGLEFSENSSPTFLSPTKIRGYDLLPITKLRNTLKTSVFCTFKQ